MKVIVPVKRVPDTAGDKVIDADTKTMDRDAGETVLCPVNEFAIEEAVKLKEATGAEVTVLLIGPDGAQSTIRKALSYGLDGAIQVTDDAISGSDALGTARVIAAALADVEFDVVIFGNQSTDARTSLVPAAVAELLDLPSLTYARFMEIDGDAITVHREHEEGWDVVESTLPAVVSVVEAINEPRYPNFKGIMAAKSKPLDVKSLADLGVDAAAVGAGDAAATMYAFEPRPPKAAGTIVTDDGSGSAADDLADWMEEQKFI
ncbi:electron transfer flavoprotein subunit beta/FixA family protein [Salsipaludibacter albus]|uniref:electron transfer flavoprotein subunit beta/FixA family protein n=1 Tax=Salsipaludibacter albus TaxID=2849650 RepID=UPI001EE3E461|nr:electron transfer flavoprotein subunit beta/FixA family protein [Salsipaludibacter albus]MBY5163080.1 electron transfer flavoprotein subunit beta/FixA family protein [Salsipaludibacter albus]